MRQIRVAAALALALVIGVGGATAQTPASAYGRLPSVSRAAVSADGSRIAMLREVNGQMGVDVIDAKSLAHLAIKQAPPDITFRDVQWSLDGRLMVEASQTYNPFKNVKVTGSILGGGTTDARGAYEFKRIIAMPVEGQSMTALLKNGDMSNRAIGLETWWPDTQPGSVLMYSFGATVGGLQAQIERVDLTTGNGVRQTIGTVTTWRFVVDGASQVRGRVDVNPARDGWTLYALNRSSWHEILREKSETGAPPILREPLADGRFALFEQRESGRMALYGVDPGDGKISLVYEDPKYDLADVEFDPWSVAIVGVRSVADMPQQHFLDPALESIRASVAAQFADGYALLDSWDRGRDVFTVRGSHGGAPESFYLYKTADKSLTPLISSYPELRTAPIGRRLSLTYKTRDDVAIPAYLTLPEGAQMKGFPLVVLTHGGPQAGDRGLFDLPLGGPHARDDASFNWMASFLASRGYAVLQPNFRGSTGYGYSWSSAGNGQWGGLMQNDVSDGVGAMIKAGITDAAHVCIAGISYGGYAALAGATLTPDLYRCAISVGGAGDLNLYVDRLQEHAGQTGVTRNELSKIIGVGAEDRKLLLPISPIEHVDAVKAPILIMHAEQDTVVPIDQSKRMYAKLTGAGKNARFVELPGDDHWLSYGPTRTQMLEEMDKFLAANLKAAPAAP